MSLRTLLGAALGWGAQTQHAQRLTRLIDSNKELVRRVRRLEDSLSGLERLALQVRAEGEQLLALRQADAESQERLARLAPVIDRDRIAGHVHGAVDRGVLTESPTRHLIVTDALPHELYEAIVELLPPRALLTAREDGTRRSPIPPKLASVAAVVLWDFVVTAVIEHALVPMLDTRLELAPTRTAVTGCQLVRREPGSARCPVEHGERAHLVATLDLGRASDDVAYGSYLTAPGASDADERRSTVLPFRANTLVACTGHAGLGYVAIPATAHASTERYSFQFQLH